MTPQPILGDLDVTEVESGVSENGKPFCVVRALGRATDGAPVRLRGQLEPLAARAMALSWLEAAEASEAEAALLRVLERLEIPLGLAALVIKELRAGRPT